MRTVLRLAAAGVHSPRNFAIQRHCHALCAPTHGAGHVEGGGRRRTARQHEAFERRQLAREGVDPGLERRDLGVAGLEHPQALTVARLGRREMRAEREETALDPFE